MGGETLGRRWPPIVRSSADRIRAEMMTTINTVKGLICFRTFQKSRRCFSQVSLSRST